MILLLDAHVFLWWLSEPERLDIAAKAAIDDPANDTLVSAASVWELEIKRASGKLTLGADLLVELERQQLEVIPILARDATQAAHLPAHHRDPFDRMLVAQAQRLEATIVSRDRAFDAYDVERLPA